MEESFVAHSVLSFEIIGWSFASVVEGSRRARICTLDIGGRERRVVRMCEPCVWRQLVLCRLTALSGDGKVDEQLGRYFPRLLLKSF
jgi:hypothetical protein